MSTCTNLIAYKGRGSVSVALRATDGSLSPWVPVAEARRLEITVGQDFEDQYSRCDPNSGNIIHAINQTDYEIALDAFDFSPAALARAYYGSTSTTASGSAAAESLAFTAIGQSLPLANPFGVTSLIIDAGAEVEGVDYSVDYQHGIVTSITITATASAAYDYEAYDVIQAAVAGVKEYAIRFDGINILDNIPYRVYMWRVAMNASSSLSLITEETAILESTGKLLNDSTKGAGESGYFVAMVGSTAV